MNTQTKIQHLYWRAGFGRSPEEWKAQENYSLKQAIDQLFKETKTAGPLPGSATYNNLWRGVDKMSMIETKSLIKNARKLNQSQNKDWLERMSSPDHSALLEKMTLFWHGHFACIQKMPDFTYRQINAIRQNALGNFKDLVLAMAKDVAMIRFLNNQQNRKRKPNENFARELMELFTIGRGNYTEQDIKEAARAFTGWSSTKQGEYVFKERNHDFGSKTFMGKTGNFDGEEIIDIILERKATADFICRKIYRYFINERIDEKRLSDLATRFYNSNYNIEQLMRHIFESDWFYDAQNVGAKIKSPIELLAGMMRTVNGRFEKPKGVLFIQRALGQVLFLPPNVAGWAGGKAWIDNSTLMLRLNLANYLFLTNDINFRVKEEFEAQKKSKAVRNMKAHFNIKPLYHLYRNQSEAAIFESMKSHVLQSQKNIDPNLFTDFVSRKNKEAYIKTLLIRMMTMPEYQLC